MKRIVPLLLVACATETATETPTQAPAPVAAADTPVAAAPAPAAPEEQEEPPPVVSNDPPVLKLSTYGKCQHSGLSVVSGEVFMHGQGMIQRMGPQGTPAEAFPYDVLFHDPDLDSDQASYYGFQGVHGRWPDQLYAVADYSERDYEAYKLARHRNGKWKLVDVFDMRADWSRAWPWYDNQILAFSPETARVDNYEQLAGPRFAVVEGPGKGPKLGGVLGRAGCDKDTDATAVVAIAVSEKGPVTAVVSCSTTHIVRWDPSSRDPSRTTVLSKSNAAEVHLALDDNGNGFVMIDGRRLSTWRDGELKELEMPSAAKATTLGRDPSGYAWVVVDDAIHVHDRSAWKAETLPAGSHIEGIAGISVGAPMLHRRDKSVWARTGDAKWHAIELPPAGAEQKIPRVTQIIVTRPGDAWVSGNYFKLRKNQKHIGNRFRAIYTQRPVDKPHEC